MADMSKPMGTFTIVMIKLRRPNAPKSPELPRIREIGKRRAPGVTPRA